MPRNHFWRITTGPSTIVGVTLVAAVIALAREPAPAGRDLAWPFRPDYCGPIDALRFSPDGKALTAVGSNNAVASWEVETGLERRIEPLSPGFGVSQAIAPDGQSLAAVRWDNSVMTRSLAGSQRTALLPGSAMLVCAIAFSPDGKTLATGGEQGSVTLRNVANHHLCGSLRGGAATVVCLAFSPDGTVLAAGDRAGTLTLWDTAAGRIKAVLGGVSTAAEAGARGSIRALAFSPDGTELASARAFERSVKLWDVSIKCARSGVLHGHTHEVFSLAYAPGEGLIASGASDGTIKLWDPATGREQGSFHAHTWQVSALAFSPDGQVLASADGDSFLRLWDTKRMKEPDAVRPPVTGVGAPSSLADSRQDLASPHSRRVLGAVSRRIVSRLARAARSRFSSPPPPRTGEQIS